MSKGKNLQPALRQRANDLLSCLSTSEREPLLIKCWMSHDARWFMAVAAEYGVRAASRLNQIAAHEIGKVEALRIVRALQLPPVSNLDDYLLAQEVFIRLLGPDLLDYHVKKMSENVYQIQIQCCFAYDNVTHAGIADQYECGILARVAGWLDALGLEHQMNPCLGSCLKAQGAECMYEISVEKPARRSIGEDR